MTLLGAAASIKQNCMTLAGLLQASCKTVWLLHGCCKHYAKLYDACGAAASIMQNCMMPLWAAASIIQNCMMPLWAAASIMQNCMTLAGLLQASCKTV
ncbi:hypothetical protein EII40_00535 [Tannerella forsythia]|uniref:Uncharacterized protein n=1 Tax=Tannerella forsythia TaxID=28112 RepID=A0A3P1XXB3_TANFO|nr:hypothetical protein EII40_00535 [Tannerella forsythia]